MKENLSLPGPSQRKREDGLECGKFSVRGKSIVNYGADVWLGLELAICRRLLGETEIHVFVCRYITRILCVFLARTWPLATYVVSYMDLLSKQGGTPCVYCPNSPFGASCTYGFAHVDCDSYLLLESPCRHCYDKALPMLLCAEMYLK